MKSMHSLRQLGIRDRWSAAAAHNSPHPKSVEAAMSVAGDTSTRFRSGPLLPLSGFGARTVFFEKQKHWARPVKQGTVRDSVRSTGRRPSDVSWQVIS